MPSTAHRAAHDVQNDYSSSSEDLEDEQVEDTIINSDDFDDILGPSITESGNELQSSVELSSVSYLQYKAALYIFKAEVQKRGLSIAEREKYLKSMDSSGEVRTLWPNAMHFSVDHRRRRQAALLMFGQWRSFTISTDRGGVGRYTSYIRDLLKIVATIVENSKLLKLREKVISNWTDHLTVQPRMLFNSEGRRIVTDFLATTFSTFTMQCKSLGSRQPPIASCPIIYRQCERDSP